TAAHLRAVPTPSPAAVPRPPHPLLARMPVGVALRGALARGYSLATLRADLLAALVVGVVAVPLSMALAIAAGVPPQHRLYTALLARRVSALHRGAPLD